MPDIDDFSTLKERARRKLERDMGPLLLTALLRATLRMRPDRILVGEVRGPEALDLVDAWNIGHEGGTTTLHANNAAAGLARLKSLITRNPSAPTEIKPLIGDVVHVVVHIARMTDGRRIQEILAVNG